MPPVSDSKLTQNGQHGRQRKFEFISQRRLRVSEHSRRGNRSYEIDIIAVDPRGRSVVHVPWSWLSLVIGGAVAALAGWLALAPGGVLQILMLSASGLAAVAGLVMMIRGTRRRRVFVSCHARLPLLDLELNRPDPKWFHSFVAGLERRIADARRHKRLERSQQLAGEIRMLRRLSEAGVFAPEVYERARSRLMKKF